MNCRKLRPLLSLIHETIYDLPNCLYWVINTLAHHGLAGWLPRPNLLPGSFGVAHRPPHPLVCCNVGGRRLWLALVLAAPIKDPSPPNPSTPISNPVKWLIQARRLTMPMQYRHVPLHREKQRVLGHCAGQRAVQPTRSRRSVPHTTKLYLVRLKASMPRPTTQPATNHQSANRAICLTIHPSLFSVNDYAKSLA